MVFDVDKLKDSAAKMIMVEFPHVNYEDALRMAAIVLDAEEVAMIEAGLIEVL